MSAFSKRVRSPLALEPSEHIWQCRPAREQIRDRNSTTLHTRQCVGADLIDCGFTKPFAMRVNFSSVARSSSNVC